MNRKRTRVLLALLIVAATLACALPRRATPTPTPTAPVAAAATETARPTSTVTPTAGPTATPTPSPTPLPPTAPLLLFREPERGQELQLDSPLVLTFDQAMDRASVERAFAIEPQVTGQFQWPTDRIAVFSPREQWAREAVYRVAMASTATSLDGIPLREEVSFRFTTTGYLEVTEVQPAPGTTEVDTDGAVTVMFNRPVVPLTALEGMAELPDPLVFEPPLAGAGEWLNTSIYVYHPDDGFAPSTTYNVTVPAGLTDTTGGLLAEDYAWSFTTLLPQVVRTLPSDGYPYVAPTQTISITFNQPMDAAIVEAGFRLVDGNRLTVSGDTSWSDDGRTLTFTPDEELPRDMAFTARVARMAPRGAAGEGAAERSYTWSFRTVDWPRVLKITPSDGASEVRPHRGVYVQFSAPMDTATLPGNLTISYHDPNKDERGTLDVTEVYSYWSKSDTELYVAANPRPSSLYTITVETLLRDKTGLPIGQRAISRFATARLNPSCYVALPGNAGTFDAYVPATVLVGYRNISTVSFQLFRMDAETFVAWLDDWFTWDERKTGDLELVNAWSIAVAPPLNESEVKRLRVLDGAGGSPAPGLYYLQVSSPDVDYDGTKPGYLLAVSRSNVVIKRTESSALVWVTDLHSGQPVAGAHVRLIDGGGNVLGEERTDANGAFTAGFDRRDMWTNVYAQVERDGELTIAAGQWNEGISPWEFGLDVRYDSEPATMHFYTDRPLYRPGQTVYYKGLIRLDDDAQYALPPAGGEVDVTIEDSQGREVYHETLPLSDMGSVYGELTLDEEAALGYYGIRATYQRPAFEQSTTSYTQFRVAEYRKPEYQIEVETDLDQYIHGDTIDVTALATYYFGGAVANAAARWAVLSQDYAFQWQGAGWYSWREWEYSGYRYDEPGFYAGYGRLIAEGAGETDAEGRITFSVPADIADQTNSQVYTIELTVTDVNGQEVSNRVQVIVHKGEFYIGLSPRSYVAQAGQPTAIDVKVVDLEQAPVAAQDVQVVFMQLNWYNAQKLGVDGRWYWEWEVEETPVYTTSVTTDAEGAAVAQFSPPEGGSYKARATATDSRGNEIRSATYFWVSSSKWISWRRENNDRIELIADKREYEVGETAEILVPSPFRGPVKALLTIERGEIIEYRVIEIETNSDILRIPILESYVPNVFVSIVLVKGVDESNELPSFKVGYVALPVSTETKALNVRLTPDRDAAAGEHYQPRETVRYAVEVTDHAGQGVETELSLDLVDAAVLALTGGDRGAALLDSFYYRRGVGIATAASLVVSADRIAAELPVDEEGKGGGGGDLVGEGMIRTEFRDTAYWSPAIRTDAQGRAEVEVLLPDNLTTWRLRGRGITADTLVGEGTVDVLSTLDVLVRPVIPRFFVVGDRATLSVVTHNNTADPLPATVDLRATGLDVSPGAQSATIPARGVVVLEWQVAVQAVDQVTVRANVEAGAYDDAVELTVPVYTYSTPEVVATAGQLESAGERLEAVILPQRLDPSQGGLTIQVDPSLAAGMRDGLDYLEHYPYECIEQTVSRWLPNVLTYRALADLGIENAALEAELTEQVGVGLQRIYREQKYDGGWGWWRFSSSNPYLSAYVLFGLVKAQDAGFTVDDSVIDDAIGYLRTALRSPATLEHTYEFNWQAFMLYVLAEADAGDLSRAVRLFQDRARLSEYGKAYLALALSIADSDGASSARVQTLLSDLSSAAILSATGAHWEEDKVDQRSMNTNTRSTAIVLDAFARLDPGNAIAANAVRWLMAARSAGHWETTQETAWSLIALTDYMAMTGELQADYRYLLALNGQILEEGEITPQDVDRTVRVEIPIADLLAQEVNRVWVVREATAPDQDDAGRLYYAMYLEYYLPVEDVDAESRGIIVARQYLPVDCDEDASCAPLDSASMGDVVRVKITIIAPHDLSYLVVEDPLPAGCEAVDRSLKTTSVVSEDPTLARQEQETGWGWYEWGWWWFTHSEVRDEKVALFADYLPRGTYEYTYLIRASVPGAFLTMPTLAYEMYFPEVWGRSAGGQMTIDAE
ncbi:MAG: Ig-like domain-containing protein [Anaerolineae bacterium]|nr:Ig-like domain-containing protein [Anaerolineae bacterium]